MRKKAVRPREVARRDIESAVDYYIAEAGLDVTLGFVDSLEAAYRAIADHPGAGSPRYADQTALPGLRSRILKRFPYLVFHFEQNDYIEIWRVPHAERDIPNSLNDPEERKTPKAARDAAETQLP